MAGALIVYLSFGRFEPLFNSLVTDIAGAERAFADGRMFFSYQLPQVLALALMLLLSGGVFVWAARGRAGHWQILRPRRWSRPIS